MGTSQGRLAGRRALITGAARGIGAAIAQTFHSEGAELALLDVNVERLDATAKSLGARAYGVDLAEIEATTAVVGRAIDELGGLEILVNNAGILKMAPLLEIDPADWDLTFAVNVRAMLVTTQVAAKAMIPNGRGTIINMASMGGKAGAPNQAHYAASKAAVISLTQVAAKELGPYGITVNCICPGYVLTEMGAATRTEAMVREWSAKSPLGRLAEPSDVANMALFLASDEASYCTGQAMNVTGGMVMH
ncbi:MAG TPA: SDR family NAD(P)-dependent oxidoreductase [Ilumatobacteraceae bacterium]|jgi:3-oxoacyl-[acyl-carrier protein] reductase